MLTSFVIEIYVRLTDQGLKRYNKELKIPAICDFFPVTQFSTNRVRRKMPTTEKKVPIKR